MEENQNLSFGIDLGIASVGWAVVNLDNDQIVDKGVYLFSEAKSAEERRTNRNSRRRKRRKLHRTERIYKVLEKNNIYLKNTVSENLLKLRNKGIKEKIDMQDIVNIIFYFSRHRGYIPFDDKDERKSDIVDELRKENLLACQIQQKIYKQYNEYRGDEYLILHSDYIKELEILLKEQSKYYTEINDNFIDKIKEIINSKRKFWEGPGGSRENQLTKYGRYKTLEDIEKYKKDKNYHKYLFEELIGNCSVYKDEKKASAWNFYAECFNFYNDMTNLRINVQNLDEVNKKFFEPVNREDYKLKGESIQLLKDNVLNLKAVNYETLFKKLFLVNFKEIYGYKKDKDGNAVLSKFEKIRSLKNKIENEEIVNELLSDINAYNKAIYLIQVSPDRETRYEILKDNLNNIYSDDLIRILSNINLENRYHKFSEKALKKYLELMEEYNENSSFIERNCKNEINSDIEDDLIENYINENIEKGKLKYVSSKYIDDIIASPGTKKALKKAISILNKLFSKHGYPKYICIENIKDLLSKEKQEEYEKKTLENQAKRKSASKKLQDSGYENTEENINKYLLLEETNHRCMYCNKEITVSNCEIEHILPRSITANDMYSNKTVSCTQCNTKKSTSTPYEYLSPLGIYDEFKQRVQKNEKIIEEKKNNLLFEQNLNKYEKSFKNRNLNDTAYATNELANQLKLFKKAYLYHNCGEILDFNILKVPGQFTGIIRKNSSIEKNRDLDYHHAVDAVIVASIPKLPIGRLINMIQNEPDKYWKINSLSEYRENLYYELYLKKQLKNELINADFSNTRMMREVNKNYSGPLFDANISKVIRKNENYYKIEQIDNIYNIKPKDIKNNFDGKKYFLCKDNNPELYNKIIEIVDMYKNQNVNPFVEYCKENNVKEGEKFDYKKHGIRQSESPNSAIVTRLRYLTKVNNPYLIDTKKLTKSEKSNKNEPMLMYDGLQSYCTRIFKDKNMEKLYFMPIYKMFVDNKSGKTKDFLPYYQKTYQKYVGKPIDEIEYYMDLYNNEYVRFETKNGEIYEGLVSGFHKTHNKIVVKKSKVNIATSTIKIEKIKSDVLGLYNLNF